MSEKFAVIAVDTMGVEQTLETGLTKSTAYKHAKSFRQDKGAYESVKVIHLASTSVEPEPKAKTTKKTQVKPEPRKQRGGVDSEGRPVFGNLTWDDGLYFVKQQTQADRDDLPPEGYCSFVRGWALIVLGMNSKEIGATIGRGHVNQADVVLLSSEAGEREMANLIKELRANDDPTTAAPIIQKHLGRHHLSTTRRSNRKPVLDKFGKRPAVATVVVTDAA